jgi:hypothetical protein
MIKLSYAALALGGERDVLGRVEVRVEVKY